MTPKRELRLFNTMSREKDVFAPISDERVGLYTCGPTVYNYAHIGNLRTYIHEDVLRRTLEHLGYNVYHVENITDVGHLESDADDGEDKMSLGAEREGKTVWEIARFYEEAFVEDTKRLNILMPHRTCRAAEHVEDMIAFVEKLVESGHGYVVDGNVYFDISKADDYGKLARLVLDGDDGEARVDVDSRKRDPRDFVLWFSNSKFPNQVMQWDSPWGRGFPGWHVECSTLSIKCLGDRLDIHCGGVDHIPVHHTNEIAQSEAYLGHKWCNHWMHCEFLLMSGGKMSKSKGGILNLDALIDSGFEPVHYRYFAIGSHYRSELEFSEGALQGAKNAFVKLRERVLGWKAETGPAADAELSDAAKAHRESFASAITDDLNTPIGLSVMWAVVRDEALTSAEKLALLYDFDEVLGLGMESFERDEVSGDVETLIKQREEARANKDWAESDRIRDELLAVGIVLKDTPDGTEWRQA
jgi:cysteinyl-tRNA synthetase